MTNVPPTPTPLEGPAGSRRAQQARVAALAGLPLVDLLVQPPDPLLFEHLDRHALIHDQWVPWQRSAGEDGAAWVSVASVAPLSADQLRSVADAFGVSEVRNLITTDWDIEHVVLDRFRSLIVSEATVGLATDRPDLSAQHPWRRSQAIGVAIVASILLLALIVRPEWTLVALLTVANLAFFAAAMFKVFAGIDGRRRRGGSTPPADEVRVADEDLPVFTILVPAYREAGITQQLVDNLGGIDYPSAKLQILLLLEEDDRETIEAFRATAAPDHVHMVLVPASQPRTKPKACNVGLEFARGEYLVVYDAEDVPDPQQLRSVVNQFRSSGPEVACIQCRLNYHNVDENILTRMFTLEYSFWFSSMVPGLDRMHLPLPLGGSSNHFRTDLLRALGGWDPHNVTEDADLGMRATALGYKVAANPSTTMEEACSQTRPWIRQRTRWIKGYMVTFLVHSRHPARFTRTTGLRGTVCLLLLIAGTPAMYLASSVVWAVWLFTFLGGSLGWLNIPSWLQVLNAAVFFLAFGSMIVMHAIAGRARERRLALYAPLLPLYWLLHSFAAWRALWHLLVKPDLWEKTPHGLVPVAMDAPPRHRSTRPAAREPAAAGEI